MAIETHCQGCQKLLRVADEHAGKNARCPSCGTIYTVPGGTSLSGFSSGSAYPTAASAPMPSQWSDPKPNERWMLKTADGLSFGPVPREELDRWLAEGRITPQAQVKTEGSFTWLPAAKVYPQLQSAAQPSSNPFADTLGTQNPYAPPTGGGPYNWPTGARRYREQHRGGAILAMSIVGLFICGFLTIAAFIMAIIDLNKMNNGTMDPSGKGLTIAGLVIASIGLAFTAIYLLALFAGMN